MCTQYAVVSGSWLRRFRAHRTQSIRWYSIPFDANLLICTTLRQSENVRYPPPPFKHGVLTPVRNVVYHLTVWANSFLATLNTRASQRGRGTTDEGDDFIEEDEPAPETSVLRIAPVTTSMFTNSQIQPSAVGSQVRCTIFHPTSQFPPSFVILNEKLTLAWCLTALP